jgi:hypothetical protein
MPASGLHNQHHSFILGKIILWEKNMAVSVERRMRNERRQRDAGPPGGCSERRRLAERRLPELGESVFSDAEWEKLFGGMARKSNTNSDEMDRAADVFDRVRDGY